MAFRANLASPNLNIDETLFIAPDVYLGLTAEPKSLAPRLFYDAAGSELFEEITRLPEYYLTRTERSILETNAGEILAAASPVLNLIELGAGTAVKTRILIEAMLRQQDHALYCPVDVSPAALEIAAQQLNGSFPRLEVRPLVADYTHGLKELNSMPGNKLVLYIGSSMGNFEPGEAVVILKNIQRSLGPGDTLLLGVDMVKDVPTLLAAYNDAAGVTARFNKNVLARINRELGGHFNLDTFAHVAIWNAKESRIEIHLRSLKDQKVRIDALKMEVSFEKEELLHTENSYKFEMPVIERILRDSGFQLQHSWFDPQRWFGVHLARVV